MISVALAVGPSFKSAMLLVEVSTPVGDDDMIEAGKARSDGGTDDAKESAMDTFDATMLGAIGELRGGEAE
jgi:hypothetical protein